MATRCFSPPDSFRRFADLGLVAVRRHLMKSSICASRPLLDLGVGRLPAAERMFVADGVVEQHGVLRNHADGGAERRLRHVADILAVDQDAPEVTS